MTLTQRIVIPSDSGKGVMAVALAALMLLAVIAVVIFVGAQPASGQASTSATSPIANAHEPVCATALARARDTRGLSAEDAIAASTAMLRACEIR
jgi:negative regulator of sigma E activity